MFSLRPVPQNFRDINGKRLQGTVGPHRVFCDADVKREDGGTMTQELIQTTKKKLQQTIDTFKKELLKIRTGRASLALLEDIQVVAYGSPMPLNQVGTVTIPESRMMVIQPWDPQMLVTIEKAILKSDLGLTPQNDGKIIRLVIPPLSEERRAELAKKVKHAAEEHRVAIRNVRRDANDHLKKLEKEKAISEDDRFRLQDEIQKLVDTHISRVDEIAQAKEKEVMEI